MNTTLQLTASDLDADLGPSIYRELRKLALHYMGSESQAHTLQATALVHEAWLRIGSEFRGEDPDFMAHAAGTMRRVLVDHARKRNALKRGAGADRLELESVPEPGASLPSLDLLQLDEALSELERIDPRAFRIVELHFFGAIEFKSLASLMQLNERTIKREWASARLWLFERISRNRS